MGSEDAEGRLRAPLPGLQIHGAQMFYELDSSLTHLGSNKTSKDIGYHISSFMQRSHKIAGINVS